MIKLSESKTHLSAILLWGLLMGSFLRTEAMDHTFLPQKEIQGKVVDNNQVPLQGATVSVKGTNVQTSTDDSGVFTLSTPADTFTLAVSYIGFLTREFPVNTLLEGEIVIELEPAQDETLDEVVVVGYGTQRKRDITGAVSSVNAQAI